MAPDNKELRKKHLEQAEKQKARGLVLADQKLLNEDLLSSMAGRYPVADVQMPFA